MTEVVSTPGPAGLFFPVAGSGSLSGEDLLALMDSLGVPHSAAELGEEEETALADLFDVPPGQLAQAGQAGSLGDHDGAGGPGGPATDASATFIAEHLPAGPGLAAVLAQDAPGGASDFDLPGMAAGYRRLAAYAQAQELAAVAEIAARRAAANPDIGTGEDGRPSQLPPEAAAEVALELRMSQYGASDWTDLACQLRWRLPGTFAALAAGTIDLARARIIAEATGLLSDEHAAAVEQRVLPVAGERTTGQLRAAVRRAVLAIDPEGAEQRRKDTERRARIGLYPDENGTATLTGSGLPGTQAAAAMARITAMARALKAAGAGGGLDLLRAHVFIGLLLGTLPLIPPPAGGPPDNPPPDDQPPPDYPPPPPADQPPPADDPADSEPPDDGPAADQPPPADDPPVGGASGRPPDGYGIADPAECPGGEDCPPVAWQDIPCPADQDAPPDDDGGIADAVTEGAGAADDGQECDRAAAAPSPHWPPLPARLPAPATSPAQAGGSGRPPSGLLDLLVPWSALAGHTGEPARLGRFGPLTSEQTRQLLALAAASPHTQWRVVLADDYGQAIAVQHARPGWHARGDPARPGRTPSEPGRTPSEDVTGVVGRVTIAIRDSCLAAARASPPAGPQPLPGIAAMVLAAARRAAARAAADRHANELAAGCAHTGASDSYRPPPRLREFIAARDGTCRHPTCGQPAWRADLDHTIPWHKGGRTCSCNLGGFCRTHHRIKHLPGWHLDQPRPGIFRWTTPAGRSYQLGPDPYPV